jgi:hypothetical protein
MIKMRKTLILILFLLSLVFLSSCYRDNKFAYIESILVYVNDELVEGSYVYFDGNSLKDYAVKKRTKEHIYYKVDIDGWENNIKVVFNVYSENEVSTFKVRKSFNDTTNYSSIFFEEEDITKEGNIYKFSYEFALSHTFNMITLTSYMSDGIKYYNVKRGKLYTLFGVYLNVKA